MPTTRIRTARLRAVVLAGAVLAAFALGRLSSPDVVHVHDHEGGDRPHVHLGGHRHVHGNATGDDDGAGAAAHAHPHSHSHGDHGTPSPERNAHEHEGSGREGAAREPSTLGLRSPDETTSLHWHAESAFPRSAIAALPSVEPSFTALSARRSPAPHPGHRTLVSRLARAPPC